MIPNREVSQSVHGDSDDLMDDSSWVGSSWMILHGFFHGRMVGLNDLKGFFQPKWFYDSPVALGTEFHGKMGRCTEHFADNILLCHQLIYLYNGVSMSCVAVQSLRSLICMAHTLVPKGFCGHLRHTNV